MEMQFEIMGYNENGTKWGDLRTVEAPTREEAFRIVNAYAVVTYGNTFSQIWAGRENGTLLRTLVADINGETVGVWNILDGDMLFASSRSSLHENVLN
jgi:hypothetical protein